MENRRTLEPSKTREAEVRGVKMKRKQMFDQTGTTLLNGVKLGFEKGFGFSQVPGIKNSAHCIDDNRIVYLLASHIVIYDMLAETQKVIDNIEYDEEVGAMTYFKNIMLEDNIVYSLHSYNKSFPSLTIMNFSKNFSQKITLANLEKQEKITDIVLLNDFRSIATISKLDKIIRLSIVEIASKQIKTSEYLNFTPIGVFSLIQYPTKLVFYTAADIIISDIEDELKMVPLHVRKWFKHDNENIVQIANSLHSDFTVYVITDQGNLYFIHIDNKEFKVTKADQHFLGNYQTLDEKGAQVTRRRRPSSLCANQYNIVIGYELIEQFTLIKISAISTQAPSFETIKFSCPFLHKIVRMTFAAETMAICVIVQVKENDKHDFCIPIESEFLKEKNDIRVKQNIASHSLPPGKIFPIIFNLLLYDTLVQTLRSPVQTVLNSMLLAKKILDICVLPTRKLILILSADKRIKAIKYEHVSSISFDKMLAWQTIFNESQQPTSLDVHPLTLNVAVGFREGIKIFNIYQDGMKTTNIYFQFKGCECVRYSRFGHLLAAGSSLSNEVLIINPYENIVKQVIKINHGYNTKQLSFVDRDMYIFQYCSNGSTQLLSLEGSKMFEVWNVKDKNDDKPLKCICSCYDPVFDIMILSYEEYQVKFLKDRGEIEVNGLWTYPFLVTKILLVNQLGTLFMGTSTGQVRAYQWPFTDIIKFKQSYTQVQLHKSPITQIKITHDYSYLITGAEDGTVFISKITPYSDGMVVSDSSILHTFKINKKNYTSLYYLQNFMCTNNCIQSEKEEEIIRYQSDRADSSSEFTYKLQTIQAEHEAKYREADEGNKIEMNKEIQKLENRIEDINRRKLELRDQLSQFVENWHQEQQKMQEKKLQQMRQLYKTSDNLRGIIQFYTQKYHQEMQAIKKKYQAELTSYQEEKAAEEQQLMDDCMELEKEFSESLLCEKEMLKEEEAEGVIYKAKMMEQLEKEYADAYERSQSLRKESNKNSHKIRTEQEKSKYLQQLASELQMDIKNATQKREGLLTKIQELGLLLKEKDKQIFNEEKAVKQLLKKSINNYSHEEYLKHKQDQLIEKAKYLQKQIESLDDKYKSFQQNFIQISKETNQQLRQIQSAYSTIESLKTKQRITKQTNFMKKYKYKQIYNQVMENFHQCYSKPVFAEKVKKILSVDNLKDYQDKEQKIEVLVDKRDHLIDQVINTNKLRKIDDTIRNTIMVKLNRETVNLTSEVNELRKEKKGLTVKIRDLQSCIREMRGQFQQKQNVKDISSLTDIVPVNISVIRSQNSKHSKPLPFQVYHQNKFLSHCSSHSKLNSKSITEDGSTQLPSIIKHSQSYAGGSILEQSSLFGVEENEDEIAQ